MLLLLSQTAFAEPDAALTLAWDPSDTPGIAAYRLYYGPQSGAYTNFIDLPLVLQTDIPGLSWGATYYFAVTAVASNGMESIPSNEVSHRLPDSSEVPTLSELFDRVTAQDVPIGISFQLGGSESALSNLTLTAWSSDPGLVSQENMFFDGTGADRVLVIIPTASSNGAARIFIEVANDYGTVAMGDFLLVVAPWNEIPTLDLIRDRTVLEDGGLETVKLTGISSGSPTELQPLTIVAASSDPAIVPHPTVIYSSPNSVGFLFFKPRANASGSVVMTVMLSDGQPINSLVVRNFHVTVVPQNDFPQMAAIPPQIIDEDSTAVVPVYINDAESPAQDLRVAATSSNPALLAAEGIQLSGDGPVRSLMLKPASNQSGDAVVTVSVTDPQGSAVSQSFQVTVAPVDDPPTLNQLGNIGMMENAIPFPITLFNITSGAQNESEVLTVTATSSNPALFPDPVVIYMAGSPTGRMVLQPVPGVSGNAIITVTVTDSGGSSFSRSFAAAVVGDTSILPDLPAEITVSDESSELVRFTAYDEEAVDVAGFELHYTVSGPEPLSPAQVSVFGTGRTRLLQILPIGGIGGTMIVTLTATDGFRSVSRTMVVHVVPGI